MSKPPSITYWNRLEPRPRSNDLTIALAARIRDPAWFLARQWQLGEFDGDDAASPAYIKVTSSVSPVVAWGVGTADQQATGGAPLERAALAEPCSPADVATRVELGQTLARILGPALAGYAAAFRAAYPIGAASDDDPRSARLRALWQGRAIDGLAAYDAIKTSAPSLPAPPPGQEAAAAAKRAQFTALVEAELGTFADLDPAAWDPTRLEYQARVYAGTPSASVVALTMDPDEDGRLDWYAFDHSDAAVPAGITPPAPQTLTSSVIPAPMRFRGMPNARFWDFEHGDVDFGNVAADQRDLARLILIDFMLVHGNDWFVIPFDLDVGSLCTITELRVHDVMGGSTVVPRADASGTAWTMFSTTTPDALAPFADYFLLPPTASRSMQDGPAVEEVHFLRDEQANLVWAIETSTEGHTGAPLPGADRGAPPDPPPAPFTTPLRYRLQTSVPYHWIPFQAAQLADGEQIALQRASMLVGGGPTGADPFLPEPRGRILDPTGLAPSAYQIREEEVPREGTRISRRFRWSRWIDGSTHLWVSRQRTTGTGEGSSGLAFDLALTPTGP